MSHKVTPGSGSLELTDYIDSEAAPLTYTAPAAPAALVRPAVAPREDSVYTGKDDVVIMRDHQYFYREDDGAAKIDVMRLGDCIDTVRVGFETVGTGGDDFEHVQGVLTFRPGDCIQSLEVPLKDDETWEPMENFKVRLTHVDAGRASLGKLKHSTVYIVDDDMYPQNFKAEPGNWQLMWGFIRERWAHRHPKPIKSLACICYRTIHSVIATYIPLLIIDRIIEPKSMDWPLLAILAGVFLASNLLEWWCDIKFIDWRGNSGTRKDLRNWLLQKYVWFTELTHHDMDDTHFFDTHINMVEEAVSKGWYQHFLILAGVFDLAVNLGLAVYLDWRAVLPLLILVPTIVVVILAKQDKFAVLLRNRQDAEDDWMAIVADIFQNWSLINAVNARDESASTFKKTYEVFYKKHRKSRFFECHYQWIPRFANEICIAAVLILGAQQCVENGLSLGRYVALIKIFERMGKSILQIGDCLIAMQRGAQGLVKVAELLNHGVGKCPELVIQEKERARAQEKFKNVGESDKRRISEALGHMPMSTNAMQVRTAVCHALGDEDRGLARYSGAWTEQMVLQIMSIDIVDMSFAYPKNKADRNRRSSMVAAAISKPGRTFVKTFTEGVSLLNHISCSIPLGAITALVCPEAKAPGGHGLSTLLKLITGHVFPTKGQMRVPPHLTSLLVHHEPHMILGTLLQNMTVGARNADTDFVWRVAEAVGLSRHLLYKDHLAIGTGARCLRVIDKDIVCLIRALLIAPDILVLSKPFGHLMPEHRYQVYDVLSQWQKREGLFKQEWAAPQSRVLEPRTVIISLASENHLPGVADILGVLSADADGVTKLDLRSNTETVLMSTATATSL